MKKLIIFIIILLVMAGYCRLVLLPQLKVLRLFAIVYRNWRPANVESIDANTSVDQVRQYEEELRTAWDNMINARADLEYARFQEFEAAYRELADSLGQISGDVTVAEALPSVQAATTTFEAELTEIRTTVCDFSPTATP